MLNVPPHNDKVLLYNEGNHDHNKKVERKTVDKDASRYTFCQLLFASVILYAYTYRP